MTIEVKVPAVGESVTEVTIEQWLKREGEAIERDNTVAVLESEKATVELPAEASGTLTKILKKRGDTAQVGETIAIIDTDGKPTASTTQTAAPPEQKTTAKPVPPGGAESTTAQPDEMRAVEPYYRPAVSGAGKGALPRA